jgi:hypothetical protein
MFPAGPCAAPLRTYALFLAPSTRIQLSAATVPTAALTSLRVSGACALPPDADYRALRHFALARAHGNYFDGAGLRALAAAPLAAFAFRGGDALAYALRDAHLAQLLAGAPARTLRSLVLLGVRRLRAPALAAALPALPALAYFALALVAPDGAALGPAFVRALPPALHTFKYQVALRRFSLPFRVERRAVLDAVEEELLRRQPPPALVCVADEVDREEDKYEELFVRWRQLARTAGIVLRLGSWEEHEEFCRTLMLLISIVTFKMLHFSRPRGEMVSRWSPKPEIACSNPAVVAFCFFRAAAVVITGFRI